MIEEYMPILKKFSGNVYNKIKQTNPVPYEDCMGEAFVIFCEALQKYDPSRGAKFSTVLYAYLKNLEKKVLLANRISTSKPDKYLYPISLDENITYAKTRFDTLELSKEGRLLVQLILDREIGADFGTGKGKKTVGKKRIIPYMKNHYGWTYKKTEYVFKEITNWWREQL